MEHLKHNRKWVDKFYQKLNKNKLNSDEISTFGKILNLKVIDDSKFYYDIIDNKIIYINH